MRIGYWWKSQKESRPRHRWVGNIKIDLREIGWDDIDWIDLAQDRDKRRALVNTVMKFRVQKNAGKFLCCKTSGFSRRAQLYEVSYLVS
jgi:hypothetical protein